SLERENYLREHRERERTWEDKVKLGYVNSDVLDGMLRLSVEHDRRRGSEFLTDPYGAYLSSSFGPLPSTNGVDMRTWLYGVSQLQKFDVADRDQNILNARMNRLFNPGLEGGVTLQWKDARYPAEVGRSDQQQGSIAFDVDYKAGPNFVLYGFYAYQAGRTEQRGVQSNACLMGQTYYFYSNGQVLAPAAIGGPAPATPAGATLLSTQTVTSSNWQGVCGAASATSPLFPDSRGWEVSARDRNDTLGMGLRYDFGRAKLDANFTRTLTRTRIGYSYNPTALGTSAVDQGLAGDGFSDLVYQQNVFSLSLLVPIDKWMALRFFDRYESGAMDDWHYAGVSANPMPTATSLYLDAGAQSRYSVNVIGVLLHVRL
ncbi:MAG TPA: MtrB/PioB family outer membrane beta-barrel protein, partial [Burkholderiales bacterium]|nr:MtrB/PioB family outer membrane beta-barrel protein [Burkholderiales bacterium]